MTPYQQLLNRKEWQDRSHYIKTRDGLKCQAYACTTPNSILQVHHFDYFSGKKPWEYPDDMLITICANCHNKENIRFRAEGNLLTALKMKGILYSDLVSFTTLIYSNPMFTERLINTLREIKNG